MPFELPPPKSKLRTLALADCIAHWRLEETSGTAVADVTGASSLTSASAANIVTGPFVGAAANRGRTVSSSANAISGASTAGQRTALAGEWTIEAWVIPSSVAGSRTYVAHGSNGTDATAANNYLAMLACEAGAIRVYWEYGAGVDVIVDSATAPIVVGELQHVAVRCRVTGATRAVDFIYQGRVIQTVTGLTAPSGGSSGTWALGALAGSLGSAALADLLDVRVASVALSDEALRESYARGVRDFDLATVIASGQYEVFGRALLRDGIGVWWDLSDLNGFDFVRSMDWGVDVDDEGASANLSLQIDFEAHSLAPLLDDARANVEDSDGQFVDLVRQVKLETAIVPAGTGREGVEYFDWQLVFHGHITDVAWPGDTVEVQLADRFRALSRTFIEPNRATSPPKDFGPFGSSGGSAVEGVLTAVVTTLEPTAGYPGGLPTIWAPVTSGWAVREFWAPPDQSVGQLLQNKAAELGWLLTYIWDDARQEFRLSFYEPDRAKVWTAGDRTISPDQVLGVDRLEMSEDDVRNRVGIEAGLTASGDNLQRYRRTEHLYVDTASEARWGPLYCRIGLASTTNLDTVTEVDRLGAAALADMSQPKAHLDVTVPFRWDVTVGDMVRFPGDDRRFTQRDHAITGIRSTLSATERHTKLSSRAASPIGRRRRWFDAIVGGGLARADGWSGPKQPSGVAAEAIANGVRFNWDVPANNGNRGYRETELHVSATSGFTPSTSTLRGLLAGQGGLDVAAGLTPGVVQYGKVLHRDHWGNVSDVSAEVSATPRQLPRTAHAAVRLSSNVTLSAGAGLQTIVWNVEAADPLNRHSTSTGEYTTLSAGTLLVSARVLYDSNSKPASPVYLVVEVAGSERRRSATLLSSGSPDRAQMELDCAIRVAAGEVVRVRISGGGNSGHYLVAGTTTTWATFTPVSED